MARYKWSFDVSGVLTECKPIIDDGTSLDYGQQSGEVFYRAKLNGSLLFRFEFDYIMNAGYNAEHIVVLQRYNSDTDDFVEVWRGKFTLTDCEIDFDTRIISVTPETVDRYTKILDHLEDEYNLVKLAAQQQPVGINVRPVYQFYSLNDTKLINLIGGNSWEASCDTVGSADIESTYHFRMVAENFAYWLKFADPAPIAELSGKTILLSGTPDYSGTPREFDTVGKYWDGSDYQTLTLRCRIVLYDDETHFALYWPSGGGWEGTPFVNAVFERDEAGTAAAITIDRYLTDANAQWDKIYCRMLLNVEGDTYHGEPLYDLQADDMAGMNLNYTKISRITPVGIQFNQYTQAAPTEWGLSYNDEYFLKPDGQIFPVGQGLWKYVSVWGSLLVPYTVFDDANKLVRIRDCYKLPSVIMRLFQRAGVAFDYFISRVLLGSNDYVGEPFYLCITSRSNVISSYYDTPAQNAPITLGKVLSMLKQVYQIYWHIDGNGNLHFEHVSYYDNGYSYTEDEPQVLVNLETEQHTRTTESKCFGQNKVKFDKQDMPAQIKFSWADQQTPPFDGWAIKMKDNYVQQGVTDEKAVGDFDSDVDFVLASPSDVSKDGLFLFACPSDGENISWDLDLQTFTIKDETGFEYEVRIQNADAAFWKIHPSFWRYALPCENIEVNNTDTNAITTGRYKSQSLEFADTAMADVIGDVDECNKVIRTQQGDGHIKTLSVNLNSLATKADLLFNFVGRFYYLRGTALGASIEIIIDNEPITIEVSDNKWKLKYSEPLTALNFNAADVVSVNFADCDKLESVTSCNDMFKNCDELLAVDFGGKKLAAVTSASGMFDGCSQLTTLICPQTSTWKPDLSFSDCPSLTTESVYSLLGYLYSYDSGVHTIDFNQTMWDALDADTQTDITTRAGAKGWTIGTATVYYINGQSAASTVYATINGTPIEIEVSGGAFSYAYNAPITSFSFENDADVTDIDFSLSDGLSGVTSLNDAFKNCAGLTTLDFTNCDLSNVATASDCFAGCSALYTLEIPSGTWQPDIDLGDTVILYSEMLNVVDGLYTYTVGTHTITFNSTIWNAMSAADQQAVYDAADAKGWTTNAVNVTYIIKGTSTNINGTETINLQFIDFGSLVPSVAEQIVVTVDASGNWRHEYTNKKIYAIDSFSPNNNTITSISFADADDLTQLVSAYQFTHQMYALAIIDFDNRTLENLVDARSMIDGNPLTTFSADNATFENLLYAQNMFNKCYLTSLSLPKATFNNVTNASYMFDWVQSLTSINMPLATFKSALDVSYMFEQCLTDVSIYMPLATFENVTNAARMFVNAIGITQISFPSATFAKVTNAENFLGYASGAWDNSQLTILDLPEATFESVTNMCHFCFRTRKMVTLNMPKATFESVNGVNSSDGSVDWMRYCGYLTTINVPQNSTAIKPTSSPSYNPMYLADAPLTYASMLKVANWLSDLTGYSAHTCTFKASAWSALSSAEQTNIDNILSGKNWNRAIA